MFLPKNTHTHKAKFSRQLEKLIEWGKTNSSLLLSSVVVPTLYSIRLFLPVLCEGASLGSLPSATTGVSAFLFSATSKSTHFVCVTFHFFEHGSKLLKLDYQVCMIHNKINTSKNFNMDILLNFLGNFPNISFKGAFTVSQR